jgi:hypothetical protein
VPFETELPLSRRDVIQTVLLSGLAAALPRSHAPGNPVDPLYVLGVTLSL